MGRGSSEGRGLFFKVDNLGFMGADCLCLLLYYFFNFL